MKMTLLYNLEKEYFGHKTCADVKKKIAVISGMFTPLVATLLHYVDFPLESGCSFHAMYECNANVLTTEGLCFVACYFKA